MLDRQACHGHRAKPHGPSAADSLPSPSSSPIERKPTLARWFFARLRVSGGFLDDLSLTLPAQPGLICIIGPRGSGKSTLAEALRYGMCGLHRAERTRAELVRANLGPSTLALEVCTEGEGPNYLISRHYAEHPKLSNSVGEPVPSVDLDRGTFLPLDAYSGAEIEKIADESVGGRRRELLDQVCHTELQAVFQSLSSLRRALDGNAEEIRRCRRQIDDNVELAEELRDAPARLAEVPRPTAARKTELHSTIERVERNKHERTQANSALEFLADLRRSLASLVKKSESPPTSATAGSPNEATLTLIDSELASAAATVSQRATDLLKSISSTTEAIAEAVLSLDKAHASDQESLAKLRLEDSAAAEAIAAHRNASKAVENLTATRNAIDTDRTRLRELALVRERLRGDYLIQSERISEIREAAAEDLQRQAGPRVRVKVLRHGDLMAYEDLLANALRGAQVRKHQDIIANLLKLRPEDLAQLINSNDVSEFATQADLGESRSTRILAAFREKLDPYALEVVSVDDRIAIELNVGSVDEPRFKDASRLSRGQKCTALLPLLLARRQVPLVIDQPEDNLDNHFIYETIVSAVRRIKKDRQLIFVTHNANIPVLGEADMVAVMESDGAKGYVRKTGTVDECRNEIVDLLEGGQEAFELRRQKYEKGSTG
jgi:energy-coupling factor transporter ATP-binding protein EcfA2